MPERTYLRPTGLVDAPFGFDGQVARLAGGLAWFSAVELNRGGETRLIPVADLDRNLDEESRLIWQRLTGARAPLRLGERVVRLDQPQVVGILNVTPDSYSDGGAHADPVTPPKPQNPFKRLN